MSAFSCYTIILIISTTSIQAFRSSQEHQSFLQLNENSKKSPDFPLNLIQLKDSSESNTETNQNTDNTQNTSAEAPTQQINPETSQNIAESVKHSEMQTNDYQNYGITSFEDLDFYINPDFLAYILGDNANEQVLAFSNKGDFDDNVVIGFTREYKFTIYSTDLHSASGDKNKDTPTDNSNETNYNSTTNEGNDSSTDDNSTTIENSSLTGSANEGNNGNSTSTENSSYASSANEGNDSYADDNSTSSDNSNVTGGISNTTDGSSNSIDDNTSSNDQNNNHSNDNNIESSKENEGNTDTNSSPENNTTDSSENTESIVITPEDDGNEQQNPEDEEESGTSDKGIFSNIFDGPIIQSIENHSLISNVLDKLNSK